MTQRIERQFPCHKRGLWDSPLSHSQSCGRSGWSCWCRRSPCPPWTFRQRERLPPDMDSSGLQNLAQPYLVPCRAWVEAVRRRPFAALFRRPAWATHPGSCCWWWAWRRCCEGSVQGHTHRQWSSLSPRFYLLPFSPLDLSRCETRALPRLLQMKPKASQPCSFLPVIQSTWQPSPRPCACVLVVCFVLVDEVRFVWVLINEYIKVKKKKKSVVNSQNKKGILSQIQKENYDILIIYNIKITF